MDILRQDLRYAMRQMAHAPAFTLTVVLVLAFGIGVNTAVLSYVRGLLSTPAPGVRTDSRLMSIALFDNRSSSRPPMTGVSFANFANLRERLPVFSSFAGWNNDRLGVDLGNGPRTMSVGHVAGDYFGALQLVPAVGALPRFDEPAGSAEPVAVLSHQIWRAQFGGRADAIGKAIRINGVSFVIVGVAPKNFVGLHSPSATLWIPRATGGLLQPSRSGMPLLDSLGLSKFVGRLASGVTREAAQAAVTNTAASVLGTPDIPTGVFSSVVVPTRMTEGPAFDFDETYLMVGLIGTATFLILLIACANISALVLGRAMMRRSEIAVRLALGATRARVLRQLLTESALLALIGAIAGLVVLWWTRDAILAWSSGLVPIFFTLDGGTLAVIALAAVLTGIIFGLAPAMFASRATISDAMKGASGASDGPRTRLQRWLIVAQLAISQPVLVATALAIGAVTAQRPWDPGLDAPDRTIGLRLDLGARRYARGESGPIASQLYQRLTAMPEVERVAYTSRMPALFVDIWSGMRIMTLAPEPPPGAPTPTEGNWVEPLDVDPDFFATAGIRIVRGRAFDAADTTGGQRSAIVPEDVARAFWPGEDPIGKRLVGTGSPRTVVGVVRTVHGISPSRPIVYLPTGERTAVAGGITVIRTRGPAAPVLAAIRREIADVEPQLPITKLATVEQEVRSNMGWFAKIAGGVSSFGLFALALASLGLAGIVSFAVRLRTREIGIRMALGADDGRVIGMFLRDGLRSVLIALAIGLPFSALVLYGGARTMRSLVTPIASTMSATIAFAVLFGVALLATWLPARRAARVDPVIALRSE